MKILNFGGELRRFKHLKSFFLELRPFQNRKKLIVTKIEK